MKTLSKICGTAMFITCFSLIAAIPGEAAYPEHQPPFATENGEGHPLFPPFQPPMPALYQASLQTNDPVQALNKLMTNVPKVQGKTYEVNVSVREIPPLPQKPKEEKAGK